MNRKFLMGLTTLALIWQNAFAALPKWSYDPGPNPNTEMGKELIDITADIPNMPEVSKQIIGRKQKFRPAFGPIPWRMLQEPNKTKILFIGQDGTHIAEAAGRPATAGFGGRAQDLAKFFGVNEGAAFINAFSFTIKGQYGIWGTPYLVERGDTYEVRQGNLVDNNFWLMGMHNDSPITKWRNRLIDWIIRNNKDSMKMIVLFGGAARDAVAQYARSKGATVEAYLEDDMDKIQVALTKEEYAGGNNTFPSLVATDGDDLYEYFVGRRLDYSDRGDQRDAVSALEKDLDNFMQWMVFTKAGPYKNGLINPAQLGGFDLDRMMVGGVRTRSLKGITLDDGTVLENDLIVIALPHPSSLSRTVMDADSYSAGVQAASRRVMREVRDLKRYADNGWYIQPDEGMRNFYAEGKNYEYGRTDIGPEYYDFGTPKNRMVSRSTARRMRGNAHVVILGTRDNGQFDMSAVRRMTEAKAAPGIMPGDLFIARPRALEHRYTFDQGPGEKFAKLMKENLDLEAIFEEKPGKSWDRDGIAAYNTMTSPSVADFGHYRGTFKNPRVLVLADPMGYDDIVTARALTGERGQYIQKLMEDVGVNDQYLVFKTVPFGMDGASESEWRKVLSQTKNYRDAVIKELLKSGTVEMVIADGEYAQAEAARIFAGTDYPVVNMDRNGNSGRYGIDAAGEDLLEYEGFKGTISGRMANIPRSHLTFYARVWEGTSGDRVITSGGKKYQGEAFAEVVPRWAFEQEAGLEKSSEESVEDILDIFHNEKLPLPYESIPAYLERTEVDPSLGFISIIESNKLIA